MMVNKAEGPQALLNADDFSTGATAMKLLSA